MAVRPDGLTHRIAARVECLSAATAVFCPSLLLEAARDLVVIVLTQRLWETAQPSAVGGAH